MQSQARMTGAARGMTGPERELAGPRAMMRDPHVIAARMEADIDEIMAAEGYVTVPQMIRVGWTSRQIRAWRATSDGAFS
jgi:hypothetical protein